VPITPYLNGVRLDPETKRVLGVAFEPVCLALRIEGSDAPDERAAEAAAVEEFNLSDEQRKRVVVQERD
jgi:hypothetical protein